MRNLAKYFRYLDRLRDSGATNMWGAGAFVERAFKLDREKASEVVGLWMKTFDPAKTAEERASASHTAPMGTNEGGQ